MKRPSIKKTFIALNIAAIILAIFMLASCAGSKDGCGAPSIGNDRTSTVLKHYR